MKDKYLAQASLTLPELIAHDKAMFLCSHSGGKDSQAMYAYMRDKIPAHRLVVIHADLGEVEWQGTWDHVRRYVSPAHALYKVSGKELLQMIEDRGMWPDGRARYCTNNSKTQPILKLAEQLRQQMGMEYIVNCTGIRAAESTARAEKEEFHFDDKASAPTKGRFIYSWLPIFNWTTREVFTFIKKVCGEELHSAYDLGMTRLSCRFCVLANKHDLQISAKHNPELLEKYSALEIKMGHTIKMHQGKPILLKDWLKLPVMRKTKAPETMASCMASIEEEGAA